MLVDFTCPVCRASLSVEDRVAGKKVDCPKCKELILIPLKPPSDKNNTGEDTILRNIIPYRNEMLAKHNKLVEAIEEIKLRNERIRELEACSMRVQKELWSIEVEYEKRLEQFDEVENGTHEKGKKPKRKKASSDASKGTSKAEKKTGGGKNPDKRVAELETELKSAIAKEAQIRRKYSELEDLKKSLENKVSSDTDLTNRLANITNNFTKLEQAQLSLQSRAEELGEENQKLKSQARQVNDSTARIAELEGDCQVYMKTFKDQEQAYHQLQEKYRQREQVLENERQLFQRLKAGGGALSDEDEALHKHLMELEKENAELQSEKSQAQSQVSKLSKISTGNANAVDELKSMQMKLSQLEIDSDDLSAENARLKNTVRTLTENLKAQWKKRDAKVQINR